MDKRTKEVIEAQLNAESAVMKELESVYKAALDAINERIRLLQTGEITQSTIYHIEYQKTLKAQISAILDKLQADEYTNLEKYLTDNYNIGFAGAAYAMHGQGVPVLMPIDKNAVYKAIVTDTKLTHPLYKEIGLDMAKLKKTVTHEISRGIASGLSYKAMARNIQAAAKIPQDRAKAIARTDGHRVMEASAEDARQAAKARGADVVKQWDATMDGDTRDTHRQLDGQIRETNEPFTLGSKSAMYPGSFGIPEEDCNCRCIATTRARWELDEDELNILKERAAFFGLDKTNDFEEFKEKYLKASEDFPKENNSRKAAETLKKEGKSGIINTKKTVQKIKDGTTVVNPMDASKYTVLKANLQTKGVTVMQAKGDDLEYMRAFGAEATYGAGYIMHIGEIPSVSALYEEIIHWTQARKYGELTSTDPVELCAREVAANRKLLQSGNAYGFDETDFEDIRRNLSIWEAKFEEVAGVSYDESDYRREV